MPQLDAYVFFDGNCAEAMRFYESVLGGKLEMMVTHGQSPMADQAPPGMADRIMHAAIHVGDRMLMASDTMVGEPYAGMKNFAVSLMYPGVAEAQRTFDALAEGGNVTMPFQRTFWAEGFGMVTDRFGTPWMVNGPQIPPPGR